MIDTNRRTVKGGILPILLIYVFLFLYSRADIYSGTTSYVFTERSRTGSHLLLIALIALIVLYYLYLCNHRNTRAPLVGTYSGMVAWIIVNFMLRSQGIWTLATYAGFILWWIFTILMVMSYLSKYPDNLKILLFFSVIMFIWYVVQNVEIAIYANSVAKSAYASLNIIYRIIVFMPLATLVKNNKIRNAIFLVCGVLTIVSMKRGAMIAYPVMLLQYVYVNNKVQGKSQRGLLRYLLGIIVIIVALIVANQITDGYIAYRFSAEQLEFGSNRAARWSSAINELSQRDFFDLLIGSGMGNSDIALHNEWLEFLYSYGVVGLIIFLSIFVGIAKEYVRAIRASNVFAGGYAMIFMYLIVLSLVSGFNFMHGTFYIMLFIGIASQFCYDERFNAIAFNQKDQT